MSLFIITHVFFVFLQVHKHALFIKKSYKKQKNEKLLASLYKKKEQLSHQLYTLKEHNTLKKFAHETLGMDELRVNNIKKL